jgi:hypothetical protein
MSDNPYRLKLAGPTPPKTVVLIQIAVAIDAPPEEAHRTATEYARLLAENNPDVIEYRVDTPKEQDPPPTLSFLDAARE